MIKKIRFLNVAIAIKDEFKSKQLSKLKHLKIHY